MNLDQIEGNEPIHENWGTNLGDEIDEVILILTVSVVNINNHIPK